MRSDRPFPRRLTGRQIRALFALWLTLVFAHCAFSTDYRNGFLLLPLIGIGLHLALLFCAVVLAVASLRLDADGRRHRSVGVAAIVSASTLLVLQWPDPGPYFRLWRNQARYESIVERARTDPDAAFPDDVLVDPGPPVRIGFVWSGLAGKWHGIVYDPSGLLARGQPAEEITMFESDRLDWARPLWGAWYFCAFH